MDEMVVSMDLDAGSSALGGKPSGASQRALLSQWQAAGYLVVASGILLALTLLRDAAASAPVMLVLALMLSLLAPPALAGMLLRLRRPRLAAVSCYLGTCSSWLLSFCGLCSAGLFLNMKDFGLAMEYAVWAILLGSAAVSMGGAVKALCCVQARRRSGPGDPLLVFAD
jgi:hypothetical protein